MFKAWFKQYKFEWMTKTSSQYSETLVRDFYVAYQIELKRQNLQGNLWKGADPISDLAIRGVQVNISS